MNIVVRTARWVVPGLIVASLMNAQQPASIEQNQNANMKAYVDLLRKDLKKDKESIMTEMMELTPR